ncbi:MAG: hydantoinase/oxoprolinase family protein [Alphaproteobacteria bacterium]|nr:hydantoinase/oxoprolinase family protein [Alphaproteobacteria bacterium]
MAYRLGVDIGGTFTDFALVDDETGALSIHKQLTTPRAPSESVLTGLAVLLERTGVPVADITAIAHGTTLVTNAVVERQGAVTGMLVTKGYRDSLDIAMERRFDLFDLRLEFADPVVPRALRAEIDERLIFDGTVGTALDEAEVEAAAVRLVEEHGIEALAVCFVHSYANPSHEERARDVVTARFPELRVTTSSEVLPFMREYERWSTTTVNAYVRPLTDRYLRDLEIGLAGMGFAGRLLVMTASGGMVTPEIARRFPVRLIESGPAAGALMAAFLGDRLGEPNLLSFDMGGTTAKGALIRDGRPLRRYEFEVAREYEFKQGSGLPLRIPVIDMIEIGAGGGSIAAIDDRDLMAVGPRSAGADPGPACYGQGGTQATLTDANLALGYLVPDAFLGGRMALDQPAAEGVIGATIAKTLGVEVTRAAWGIHEVINEDVARAFRVHASEIGFDYRRCAMIAFGGSGPAHAIRVARKLRIPKVIFPVGAGVMSAIGLLTTPISYATLRSGRTLLDALDEAGLEAGFAPVERQALELLVEAGVSENEITMERRLDMRFHGQGHEVEVALPEDFDLADLPELFRQTYAQVFAATPLDAAIEIVNWKIEASGPRPDFADRYRPFSGPRASEASARVVQAYRDDEMGFGSWPVVNRYALDKGASVEGPALIQEDEATTVLGPGERVEVDALGNLVAILVSAGDAP